MVSPEDRAREIIDRQLTEAGWVVQDARAMNLHATRGAAVREYQLKWGPADYAEWGSRNRTPGWGSSKAEVSRSTPSARS